MYSLHDDEGYIGVFSTQMRGIEGVEDPEERNYYYAVMGYDLVMDECRTLDGDPTKLLKSFIPDSPYENYLLPGVNGNGSYENVLREYTHPSSLIVSTFFEVGDYSIARVPQCNLYKFPLKGNPLLFLSMTECSALVANDGISLYVAHVGLSEVGEIEGAVKFFRNEGIPLESVFAHASIGDKTFEGVKTPHFDYSHASLGDYVRLGIPEQNIHSFPYKLSKKNTDLTHENTRGIFVGRGFHVAFSFNLSRQGRAYVGDANIRDILSLEE